MRSVTSLLHQPGRLLSVCVLAFGGYAIALHAQKDPGTAPPAASDPSAAPAVETPKDPLGRSTPNGAVRGFLNAARRQEYALAAQYLNTRATGERAEALANDLFVVLDVRLPARLARISDEAEGSRANPLVPDQEVIGTVSGRNGNVDIVLERVRRGESGPIWLFSSKTLDAVPALYEDVVATRRRGIFGGYMVTTTIAGIRAIDWFAVLIALPLMYVSTIVLNRVLTPLIAVVWRRLFRDSKMAARNALPIPARLLLLVIVGRWLLFALPLSLTLRQGLSNVASLVTIGAIAWLLILVNGEIEGHLERRIPRSSTAAATSLLRLLRRSVDLLVVFAALIAFLRYFGIDPTPALAGLGVGGIAVALAAQKTLENVIAGASLIFDQAVRVGDFLKMGDIIGTVDHIGLRSTRIRTLDRTVVSVPNGQIANASLETFSARDKFWFHPMVTLRYQTTPEQLQAVVDGIRQLLERHPAIDGESIRVRFFRLGTFSLDIDVFAYLHCRDWNHFLEIQERLLFDVAEIVHRAGASIAIPSQTMYMATAPGSLPPRDAVGVR
jgi:MscS family membrane protein